ncbi:putative DNA binding phosphoprotein [Bovine papular stomatitis virus]|uniref:Protein OPG079 n=1 Tax=Bovine papular stomatitis virus TaxID=129727 RepID=V5LTE9_9POXV|nr:putative DNA binding phosphoprotein [Bovine papular stomatitis virus]
MKRASACTKSPSARQPTDESPNTAQAPKKFDCRAMKCIEAVEFARSLSTSQTKAIESVTLTPSQYPSCSNISVTLVESLASRLVAPLVMLKGEFKIHASKKTDMQRQGPDSGFFARIKPVSASQMLYQLLEGIYTNILEGTRVPHSLRSFNVETSTDATFKSGCIYINRLSGALVEFTHDDGAPSQICPIMREIEALASRDAQMATAILSPIVLYRAGCEAKVTFALKKVTMPRECTLTVLGLDGESTSVKMSETPAAFGEEQEVRGLGVVDPATLEEEDAESPFNI